MTRIFMRQQSSATALTKRCLADMRCVALVLAALASAAGAQPADWTVKRDPFDRGVVARYKAILARDPYDAALTALMSLYRKHRTLALLDDEYRASEDWAGLVVRARLHDSLELWRRVV